MKSTTIDLGQVAAKYQLQIDLTINVLARFEQAVGSPHAPDSPEFRTQFDAYAADYEHQYKDSNQWLVRDLSRAASWEIRPDGDGYICTVMFTIREAVARVVTFADSPYRPETPEHAAWLDQQGQQVMQAWLSERPQLTPIE